MSNASVFLEQKVLETIGEYGVPALAAAVVASQGTKTAWAQRGIRKVGASGVQNEILGIDKFNLGSISKVVTGFLMAKLIQESVGGLTWNTTILDVFPELASLPGWQPQYGPKTVQQLLSHTAGFPYQPSVEVPYAVAFDWVNYTAAYMTDGWLMERRKLYVDRAVVDPPLYDEGHGCVYDGGGIICAAMAEKLTGKTYEQLVQHYVCGPLGMANSGFGRLDRGYPDTGPADGPILGPWQHGWDDAHHQVLPDQDRMQPGYNFDPRTPVGDVAMSASDMVAFLREQVIATPTVCNPAVRTAAQTTVMTPTFVRGGWGGSGGPITQIAHDGDNGVSYASATVRLDSGDAYAAMCNMNSILALPAVYELNAVSRSMLANWKTLFEEHPAETFVACDHPCPALTIAAGVLTPGPRMVFARKHNGSAWRKLSTDGGAHWSVAVAFPAAVITSGLAACSSLVGDTCSLFGRGMDQRVWCTQSTDGGTIWQVWLPVGGGLFRTGPAAAASSTGAILHVVAIGLDQMMYRTRSNDGGLTWSDWAPIGAGTFTSAPALASSADGLHLYAVGRGSDWRVWFTQSTDGGATWQGWQPIGIDVATSSPAAATSSDGAVVHVVARGKDRRMWRNASSDASASWLPNWQPIGSGTFTSAPAIAAHATMSVVSVVALGDDFRLYASDSANSDAKWNDWSPLEGPASEFFL